MTENGGAKGGTPKGGSAIARSDLIPAFERLVSPWTPDEGVEALSIVRHADGCEPDRDHDDDRESPEAIQNRAESHCDQTCDEDGRLLPGRLTSWRGCCSVHEVPFEWWKLRAGARSGGRLITLLGEGFEGEADSDADEPDRSEGNCAHERDGCEDDHAHRDGERQADIF